MLRLPSIRTTSVRLSQQVSALGKLVGAPGPEPGTYRLIVIRFDSKINILNATPRNANELATGERSVASSFIEPEKAA